jgi:hypothetical protein
MLLPALDSTSVSTDVHGLKIQGGSSDYLQNSWGEGRSRLSRKNCHEGFPILGFISFLLTSLLKFSWGVLCFHPPLSPSPPVGIYECFSTFFSTLNPFDEKFSCGTRKHQQKCVVEPQAVYGSLYLTSFDGFIALLKISQNP